ncbi:phosphonoacetaldehyde hydrolase [bacterium]|jgi:phosphonoacetaldehyde hydrolase|nr:phosphonoacetaldehyde hydrolase [bacterium]
MNFHYRREYCGPLQAIILDWAGTTIDYGCRAPAAVFIEVFKDRGIDVSTHEAREPMGMAKRDHIKQILLMPRISDQWKSKFDRPATEQDIDDIYRDFIPKQIKSLPSYSDIIPGVPTFIDACRTQGLKIGATTGYNFEMMDICAQIASKQGYSPDASFCADDVPAGRPAPWMAIACAMKLEIYPMESIVKIGDTYADIEEGLNAGMWTIGISQTGNELGLSEAEIAKLEPTDLEDRLLLIEARMKRCGAHYTAHSVADCLAILEEIDDRLASGDHP